MNSKTLWQWLAQKTSGVFGVGLVAGLTCSGVAWTGAQLPARAETASPQAAPSTPAAVSAPAPTEIIDLLKKIDTAASRQDLNATLKFYSPAFTSGDGLDYKTFGEALKGFWQTTKSLQYQTQINNWQSQGGDHYLVETTTTVQGTQTAIEREMQLSATIRSRITITGQQIQTQEILSEQTRLTAGSAPPTILVNLPEQVNVGQSFSFDAIVKEPLGDALLLGSALEEPITPERYLRPSAIALEPLSAGGVFKVGQAPQQPSRHWISAILVKDNGITIVSQRLSVVRPNASTSATPR
ncbi:MAG TPA: nuclear transport factor 2 family protein [Stenomitos sp.]